MGQPDLVAFFDQLLGSRTAMKGKEKQETGLE